MTYTSAMHRKIRAALAASWLAMTAALAQHGHPLDGSWSGDWRLPDGQRQRLLFVLEYHADETITGNVFFGTQRLDIRSARLEPASWSVRVEVVDSAASGAQVVYVIEGRIENLGSTRERAISGVLSGNGRSGDFRVVMN